MVNKSKEIRNTISSVIRHLEYECGCTCNWEQNKHNKITFNVLTTGMTGVVTTSVTPNVGIKTWKREVQKDFRKELRRCGIDERQITTIRDNYLSLVTGTQGEEELKQLENLIKFCKSRTKLNDDEIEELYLDKQENFPITQLVEKYGVSKTTIYRYLKVYKTIQKT